jgi:hypothetical protein
VRKMGDWENCFNPPLCECCSEKLVIGRMTALINPNGFLNQSLSECCSEKLVIGRMIA